MTSRSVTRGRSRLVLPLLAAVVVASGATVASAAPSPAAMRDCIERNLPRYSNPGSAVVAQYSDVATACRSLLEGDDGASVTFTPAPTSPGASAGGDAAAATPKPAEAGAPPPAESGAGAPAAPTDPGDAPGRTGTTPRGASPPAAGNPSSAAALVRVSAGTADAGSPIPSSFSGGQPWLYLLLGGAAVAVAGAVVAAVRRRPR